jgi:Second Messenger Oligonucleotide or Dinucleotide Synthetase domain
MAVPSPVSRPTLQGPTASPDTGCGYYPGAAIREPTGNNITTSQVPTKSGEPRHKEHLRQGSWAHETIINPVSDYDEFDADILLHLENVARHGDGTGLSWV